LKANLESPTFTGTVTGISKTMVGLSNVDNTSDVNKPVSTAQQTALNLKANLESPTFTGTVSAPTVASSNNSTHVATTAYVKAVVGDLINSAPGTLDTLKEITDALGNDPNLSGTLTTAIGLKAPLESPTFTGTVSGISPTMIGLGNVDNTSDVNKPVSTAQQTALNLKADLESPTFTGDARAPTVSLSDNSTIIATTAFIQGHVNTLSNSISSEIQARTTAIQNEASNRQASDDAIIATMTAHKAIIDLLNDRISELYTYFNQTYASVYAFNHP
jgi:fibronectin type 3 domain-containing protein